MRSVDAINGEIGQLEDQIRKHEKRVAELKDERAEVILTGRGFKVGQTISYQHGRGERTGKIVGFCEDYGASLICRPVKKNGELGEGVKIHSFKVDDVKILADVVEKRAAGGE